MGSKRMYNFLRTFVLVVVLFFNFNIFLISKSQASTSRNLDLFKQHSPYWKALEAEEESLIKEFEMRDIVLAPMLSLEATGFTDNRNQLLVLPIKQEELLLSARVSKYFGTGTLVDFSTGTTSSEYRTGPLAGHTNHIGNFQLSLTQNLLRDSFGASERIRKRQNQKEYELRKLQLDLQQANLIINFEDVLWNYLAADFELKLRQESLKNWREIEKWMKSRYQRSAAELVDVKQISATRILREIQVQTIQQTLSNLKRDLDQLGGAGFADKLNLSVNNIELDPSEIKYAESAFSLQTLILEKTASVSEQQMLATLQNNKPDLKLNFTVSRMGIDNSAFRSFEDSYGIGDYYTRASLVFSTPIDFNLLKTGNESAKLKFKAASLRRDQSIAAAKLEWNNLKDQISEHVNRVSLLKSLTKEQKQRNKAENSRFRNGRSTSLQVVTAEQETLDAELTLRTTQASLKKLIARYRLFDLTPH